MERLLDRQDTYKGSPWSPWTQNLYVYVGNNPINYTDPTGHERGGIAGGWVPTLGLQCFLYDDCALVTVRDMGFGLKPFFYAVLHLPDFLVEGAVIGFSCTLSGGKRNALCKDLDKMGLTADTVTLRVPAGSNGKTVVIELPGGKSVTAQVDADGKKATVTAPDGTVTVIDLTDGAEPPPSGSRSDNSRSGSSTDGTTGGGGYLGTPYQF